MLNWIELIGVARYVPLSDDALLLLHQPQLQSSNDCLCVFANPESLKSYSSINKLRMHDLHHSAASFPGK
jgi:hypothetical protein